MKISALERSTTQQAVDEGALDPVTHPKMVRVAGFDTIAISRKGLAEIMVADCLTRRDEVHEPKLVFSSNGQGISLAARDPAFRDAMRAADIIHADGMPVVAGAISRDLRFPSELPRQIFFTTRRRQRRITEFHFTSSVAAKHRTSLRSKGCLNSTPRSISSEDATVISTVVRTRKCVPKLLRVARMFCGLDLVSHSKNSGR